LLLLLVLVPELKLASGLERVAVTTALARGVCKPVSKPVLKAAGGASTIAVANGSRPGYNTVAADAVAIVPVAISPGVAIAAAVAVADFTQVLCRVGRRGGHG